MVKENGNYIAVKVSEYSLDYWYHSKTQCVIFDRNCVEKVLGHKEFEIIGLLSDVVCWYDSLPYIQDCELDCTEIPESEFNKWLIIKKA